MFHPRGMTSEPRKGGGFCWCILRAISCHSVQCHIWRLTQTGQCWKISHLQNPHSEYLLYSKVFIVIIKIAEYPIGGFPWTSQPMLDFWSWSLWQQWTHHAIRAQSEPWHGGIALNLCCSLALSLSLIFFPLALIYLVGFFAQAFKRCQDVCIDCWALLRDFEKWGGISSFWRYIAENYQMLPQNWLKCAIRIEGADRDFQQICPHCRSWYYGGWSAGVPPTFTIRISGRRSSAVSCNATTGRT